MKSLGAHIVSLEEFVKLKPGLGKIVAVSGGFDPIHPGHISNIQEAKKLGDTLVVIVNGDAFLRNKKGKPFQDLHTRCSIVSAIREVDYVVPFEIENDQTVVRALEVLKPHIFAKGGDRSNAAATPEFAVCQDYNIEVVFNIGMDKAWSSSDFLANWVEYIRQS
jgi:D-beta-D-heptose 7-phosphate kinase/D-beta-D-heptose 1-phosphate adenosyltransferase